MIDNADMPDEDAGMPNLDEESASPIGVEYEPDGTPVVVFVHGPNVQEADVWRAGLAYCDLFDAVASHLVGKPVEGGMTMTGVKRMCDGCGLRALSYERPAGWITAPNGDDFCTACLHGGER